MAEAEPVRVTVISENYLDEIAKQIEAAQAPPPKPKKKKLTKAEKKARKLLAQQEFQKLEMRVSRKWKLMP